jgi:alpha-ketoglutarate-dependent taurine dioxygenase
VSQVNTATHPVFRTHEETGRKAVYVNRLMTERIEQIDPTESQRLLDAVFAHSENTEWTYEHHWQPNDLLVWDNRCSMHARTDFAPGERRLMLRTTISGDERPT